MFACASHGVLWARSERLEASNIRELPLLNNTIPSPWARQRRSHRSWPPCLPRPERIYQGDVPLPLFN